MTNLRTVAVAAGVHVATASAVLSPAGGNTRVSIATRKRVLAVASRLSYVPNETARRLRTGRSNVVAFLGGDLRNPFFAELTAALEGALGQLDLQILVSHITQTETGMIERNIESLRQQKVKAIICWSESAGRSSRKKKVCKLTLPVGFTRHERPGVWLDLEFAIRSGVEEMIRRGFRKLGFYFPKGQKESPSVVARLETFITVCKGRSLVRPAAASYEGESWDLLSSIMGARQVFEDNPGIEAWIGFNDIASLGLLRCLPSLRADRVLCFDGTILARSWPENPACLDLKIPEFAKKIVAAIVGEQDVKSLGRRENWLRPSVMV